VAHNAAHTTRVTATRIRDRRGNGRRLIRLNAKIGNLREVGGDPTRQPVTGGGYAATENDVRTDLNAFASIGRYDNVTVVWKAPTGASTAMPLWGWGTAGGCVSVHVNSTGFTTLAVTDVAAPITGELLHLWLETAAGYDSHFGFLPMPDLNAIDNGAYTHDPVNGWASFYQAFMTGRVVDARGKPLGGITKAMWASGTPTTRPVGCYWFHDP
jgi:hypothetical protein